MPPEPDGSPDARFTSRVGRAAWLGAGVLCVALGAIGAVLPMMPTVPFLLAAAFFFARSNPAWEKRLLEHERWGPSLRNWRERRAISRKAKVSAILAMSAGAVVTWYTLGHPWYWISIAVLVIAGTWIATRSE